MSDIKQLKIRIERDIIIPMMKIKADESALRAEVEQAGVDYAVLKRVVRSEFDMRDSQLKENAALTLEYLDS